MQSHSTEAHGLASASLSLRAPALRHSGQSLWLMYCRMIGLPGTVCICLAAVLHQLECKLRNEPTHWGATSLLIGLGLVMFSALWIGTSRGVRLLVSLAALCCASLLSSLWLLDLCEEHQALSMLLVGISTTTCLVASRCHSQKPATQTTLLNTVEAVQVGRSVSHTGAQPLISENESTNGDERDFDLTAQSVSALDSKQPRPVWARYAIGIVLVVGFVVYMVIVPAIGMVINALNPDTSISRELTDMSLSETLRLHAVSGVVMLMFLAMGASIGSFLNVVIYRLPRYRPLLWPPSACPNCGAKISGMDNVPIIAWLRLGGRCRHCHVAISARYPLIESLIAAVFVLFYYRELLSGGQNLPVRPSNSYNGIVWILLYTKWDLVSIYFFHMTLLVLLLGWGMINFDRFRVPWYAATGMVALSVVLVATFPTLNPLAAKWSVNWFGLPPSLSLSLIGCAFGALMGLSYEWAAGLLTRTSQSSSSEMLANESLMPPVDQEECMSQPIDQENEALVVPDLYGTSAMVPVNTCNAMASAALLGSQLGVEAVAVVFALSVILCIAANLTVNRTASFGSVNARPVPLTLVIFVVALVYLAFWHQTHGLVQNMLAGRGLGQLRVMS